MPEENGTKQEAPTDGTKQEAPTELEQKIIKQVEYYFGDMNLGRDKFLLGLIKEDNGWVTFETMTKFNRLRILSDNVEVLAAALKKSNTGLMEVSEDGTKLRRLPTKPLPEFNKERRADLQHRSIYAKSFPQDASLDQLIEFFEQYGATEQVQMRRNLQKEFKGSCFVVYKTAEAAKKFVESESVKFGEVELEKRLFKDAYFQTKTEERKKRRETESKQKAEAIQKQIEEDANQKVEERMTKGAILEVTGLSSDTTREDIKKVFLDYGVSVAWVDLTKGDTEGRIRFSGEGMAKTALEKLQEANEGKAMIKGQEVQGKVLEGQEEIDHWKNILESQKEQRNRKRRGRDQKKGGKRGGYKGFKKGNKRPRKDGSDDESGSDTSGDDDDNDEGEPTAKVQKTD